MKKLVVKNRLKEIREASGKTQETLANLSGTTQHTIDSIEKDIYCPSLYLALCISFVMHKSVEEIFYLDIKEIPDQKQRSTLLSQVLKVYHDAMRS